MKSDVEPDNQSSYLATSKKWRYRVHFSVAAMIFFAALFFFAATLRQLDTVQQKASNSPRLSSKEALQLLYKNPLCNPSTDPRCTQEMMLFLLEKTSIDSRYHQANVLLISRVWVRYLGFVAGMILAFLGAAFVVGQIREPESHVAGKTQTLELTMKSASPGIIISTLGVSLLISTILIHNEIETKDTPLYFNFGYEIFTDEKPKFGIPDDIDFASLKTNKQKGAADETSKQDNVNMATDH